MLKLTGKLSLAFVGAIALAWIFFGINSVWAQDVTGEPAATVEAVPVEVTAEAPAEIVVEDGGTVVINEQPAEPAPAPEPTFSTDNLLKLTIAIMLGIVGGGTILDKVKRLLNSKKVKDEVEAIYMKNDSGNQELVKGFISFADKFVDLANAFRQFSHDVTDGKENLETPTTPPNQPVG